MDFTNELFGVSGKSVLVTGGTRGIGYAIAEGFVKAGARVYICSRDAEACKTAASQLQQLGHCIAIPGNLAASEDRDRLFEELTRRESSLGVMINNAGAIWSAPLAEYPESGWDKVFDLNVKATFFLIQKFLPLLQTAATAEDPARIINIGSINVLRIPDHETYAYVSSKAALHHMTRHLAARLAPSFITANVIAPGYFPSRMLAADIARRGEEELIAPIPLKRLSVSSDMAGAAIFLASKAGSYLTGVVLPVDGGSSTTK